MGGLGNQMFQYACGRRLSLLHNTKLIIDTKFIEDRTQRDNFTFRDYELKIFNNISVQISDLKMLERYYKTDLYSRILKKMLYPKILSEQGREFNARVLSAGSSLYLIGYWQSEKYFLDIKDVLKKDFEFPSIDENEYINTISKSIAESNSISIHIRRGDYVKNQFAKSIYTTLSNDYYQKAINYCNKKVKEARFFIFSDDPQYVQANFSNIKNLVIVDHKDIVANYVDMKLMSLCKHNIIANSSYSWWAAWLNNNTEKIVISPKKWYVKDNNEKIIDSRIPNSWISI